MSVLFSSKRIGKVDIKNRFVNSATYESMAKESGEVTDELIKKYRRLAKGGVGLSITGHIFVHASGRGYQHQVGIHNDTMIPGLKRLVEAVHHEGGKVAFQIGHCGRQTTKKMCGQKPVAPSSRGRDPLNFVKPKEMSENEINEIIKAFGAAAKRAVEAEADSIQLHGAHGYLISEFLSPYFNVRTDSWGGSDEKRFRFLKEVFQETKKMVPDGFPVLVKLNSYDHTPQEGVTPYLTKKYTGWLKDIGIDGVEISCGTTNYSYMNMSRGDVPTEELVKSLSWWEKPIGRLMISKLEGKYDLEEGYNMEPAKLIKPALDGVPLFLVGGLRKVSHMEELIEKNVADFISMSRPFIREPFLVNKIKKGEMERVSCVSCNRCLAGVANEFPVYCYNKRFPDSR
jgi:2,4-dienoyl-CoA reductase-like NADH-dependent reductase (Old Yellow Enzyme family)